MEPARSKPAPPSPRSRSRLGLVRRACAATALAAAGVVASACTHDPAAADHAGAPAPIAGAVALGGLGETPGRFGYPRALDCDASTLWVIDKTARVQRIDPSTGACLGWWRMPEYAVGKPVGFSIVQVPGSDDELLYIADTHYSRVMVYRVPHDWGASGEAPALVRSWGSYGHEPGQFIWTTDVAVLTSPTTGEPERIFVSEYGGNDRVSAFDAEGNFLFSFGAFGSGSDPAHIEFQRPQSLALARGADGRTELLVTDSRNHRVGRFSVDGVLIAWIGSPDTPGDQLGEFRYPYGIAPLNDGTALVAEYGNNRVQRIELKTGRGMQVWGRAGRGGGELATPWGIAVMGNTTYILDTGNNRVVGFPSPRPART